ncbi:glyoxalase superfamily protein [Bacillus sp. FJAT-28004]|uniref:glyoxalase superfamily protein n=1 Tax=Bacillus sp. FJAT-28004 TaxID=1679165 RepID=UPI001F2F550B|nr:glyoxalase superfamily protein [Bacillus sp. FJAT-28004]
MNWINSQSGRFNIQSVTPAFRITDYSRSKEFYVEEMNLIVDREYRFETHFPIFVQITKNDMTMYLTERNGDCQVGGLIHLFVPNVDSLMSKKIGSIEPPHVQIEGLRMMTVVVPDGNQWVRLS